MTDGLPQCQAFIGVGTMGSLMAGCLLDAGVELTVHDRRRTAASSLLARGARWAGSPAAATADCGIVLGIAAGAGGSGIGSFGPQHRHPQCDAIRRHSEIPPLMTRKPSAGSQRPAGSAASQCWTSRSAAWPPHDDADGRRRPGGV